MSKAGKPTAEQLAWLEELRAQRAIERQAQRVALEEQARRIVDAGGKAPPGTSLYGVVADLRGHLAEERLVRVLNEATDRPAWLGEASLAPPDLDALGVDLVVQTDAGPIPLQVKSCAAAAETWRRGYPDLVDLVGVMVAPIELPDPEALAAAIAELERLRAAKCGP